MDRHGNSEESMADAIEEQGADAGTRDVTGRRYGGEQLGQHPGPVIWLTVVIMCVGFTIGGVAIVYDSLLWFIIGTVIFALAGLASLAAGIMKTTE
jgi:hypothetical protein